MKQIFLFLLLAVTFNITAQKTYSIEKPLQLNTVNEGAKSDSVLVRGVDKVVKFIPRSEFGGADNNTLLHTTGNETKNGTLNLVTSDILPNATALNALSPLTIVGGKGGNNTNTAGTVIAGNAANISIKTGWGGSVSGVAGTGVSGNGGDIILLSGDGGVATGTGTLFPGKGGDLSLQAGSSRGGTAGMAELKGGNNDKLGAKGGNVHLIAGWGNNSFNSNLAYDGTIFLGVSQPGVVRGNTVIGNAVDDRTNKLQVTGSSKFSGIVTADSFVKAEGTSSQFLKADGSVDSNSYASLTSPAFAGIPTAPTPLINNNSTQIATTAYVSSLVAGTNIQNVNLNSPQTIYGAKTFAEKVVISGINKYLEFPSGGLVNGAYITPTIGAYNGYFSIAGSGGSSSPVMIKTPNSATTNLYEFPDASGVIAITLNASATLDFPNTNPGSTSDLTVTVSGAVIGDVVSVGVPAGSVQSNAQYTAFVNAANSVTVRFSNLQASASQDPASGIFKVKVFK
ncbi:hypothetical protein [Flavobacterium panacagri]|uniref:hypothetical protein n=1 Tax=Flavobacterium panacagri TaxID=3034146 RepID=UPI0025A61AEC|nr:hypothetical protein [Flavobacterium panacagri]